MMKTMYQLNQIPSEAQIRKFLRRIIFGKNLFCPRCRSPQVVRYEARYRCKRCREKFSLISHTWLSGMKLSYQQFWLLLWCWTAQIPVKQATALSEMSTEAVRRWYDRFRGHLPEYQPILEHMVQLDEAFFRRTALMMGKQPGSRKVVATVIPQTTIQRHHALFFLEQHVRPGSILHTDGAGIYRGIERFWPVQHKTDIHSRFEFSLTSEIEGMFGVFRTFIRRMYHHVTPEKLPEYVSEFCFRFSFPEMYKNPLFYLEKSLTLVPIDL